MINTYLEELFKKPKETIIKINRSGKIAIGNEQNIKQGAQTITIEKNNKEYDVYYMYPKSGPIVGLGKMKVGQEYNFMVSEYTSDYYSTSGKPVKDAINSYIERDDMEGGTYTMKGTFSKRKSRIPLNKHEKLDVLLKTNLSNGIYRIQLYNDEGVIKKIK